jgi:hypothetical protein
MTSHKYDEKISDTPSFVTSVSKVEPPPPKGLGKIGGIPEIAMNNF